MPSAFPAWVPFVFLLLVYFGYRLSLPRVVRPGLLVAMALLMLGLSLQGVLTAFGASPVAVTAWAVAWAVSALGGSRWLSFGAMTREGTRVRLDGSWLPLGLMLAIFAARFTLGVLKGTDADIASQTAFQAAMGALLGLLGGGFGARAIAACRVAAAPLPGTVARAS